MMADTKKGHSWELDVSKAQAFFNLLILCCVPLTSSALQLVMQHESPTVPAAWHAQLIFRLAWMVAAENQILHLPLFPHQRTPCLSSARSPALCRLQQLQVPWQLLTSTSPWIGACSPAMTNGRGSVVDALLGLVHAHCVGDL